MIIAREYLTRVRKRSFIIMTVLGPVLLAALFVVPIWLAQIEGETKVIGILDETGLFVQGFHNTDNLNFVPVTGNLDSLKSNLPELGWYALLYIPATELSVPNSAKLYSTGQPNLVVTGFIRQVMRKKIEEMKLQASGFDPEVIRSIKSSVNLLTIRINEGGEEKTSSTELAMGVGYALGIIIYFFIFMYGAQVMRGVIEEKTNRIIEVIISSVKPFELMMGKVVGVALVGLTQFTVWVVATLILVSAVFSFYSSDIEKYQASQLKIEKDTLYEQTTPQGGEQITETLLPEPEDEVNEAVIAIFDKVEAIPFGVIIPLFLFYFIGGYLLYGALFAAIGSAVDNETDTQQFMLPVTVPLILSVVVAQFIVMNPDGPLSFWLSVIPLTSPVVMMIRLPFEVPVVDVVLSMVLLIAGFLGTIWLAGRIYRTGILMYGKKVSYRELAKWIKYHN